MPGIEYVLFVFLLNVSVRCTNCTDHGKQPQQDSSEPHRQPVDDQGDEGGEEGEGEEADAATLKEAEDARQSEPEQQLEEQVRVLHVRGQGKTCTVYHKLPIA